MGNPVWHVQEDHALAAWSEAVARLGAGELYWQVAIERDKKTAAAAITEADGGVFVHLVGMKHSRVVALDPDSGAVRWDRTETGNARIPPAGLAVGGGHVMAAGLNGLLRYDISSGERVKSRAASLVYPDTFAAHTTPSGSLLFEGMLGSAAFDPATGEEAWASAHGMSSSTCAVRLGQAGAAVVGGVLGLAITTLDVGFNPSDPDYVSSWNTMTSALSIDFDSPRGSVGGPAITAAQSPAFGADLLAALPSRKLEKSLSKQGGQVLVPSQPTQRYPLEMRSVWAGPRPLLAYETHDLSGLDETPCSESDAIVIDPDTGLERARVPLDHGLACAPAVAFDEQAGLAYQAFTPHSYVHCKPQSQTLRAMRLSE